MRAARGKTRRLQLKAIDAGIEGPVLDHSGPVIRLAPLTREDLYVLLENVRRVYASGVHPLVRDWVSSRWAGLRPVQQEAVAPILAGRDTLVVAPTASGKTEAAFLPICSLLLSGPPSTAWPCCT